MRSSCNRNLIQPEVTGVELYALACFIAGYAVAVAFCEVKGFNLLVPDASEYLAWSRQWWDFHHGNVHHLPLYPMVLWLFRTASLGWLDNVLLLRTVTLVCTAVYLAMAHWIASRYFPEARNLTAVLLGLYPFLGLSIVHTPVSDSLATCCVIGALACSLGRRWGGFALCLAAGLVCHKAIWGFLGLLALEAVARRKCPVAVPLLAGLSLALYWAWGVSQGQELLWMVKTNLADELGTHSSLPVLDGLVGSFIYQTGAARLFRSVVVLCFFLMAVGLLVWNVRRRHSPDFFLHLALILPVLALLAVLNQYAIWSAFYYSRPIMLSLAVTLSASANLRKNCSGTVPIFALGTVPSFALGTVPSFAKRKWDCPLLLENRWGLGVLCVMLLASNFLYTYYIVVLHPVLYPGSS